LTGSTPKSNSNQCEKHGKKEEALAKLKDGAKFDDVAREFSEDKARAGMFFD
jgi:parvulin-like peptidyl-prolyl isomerase